MLIEFSVGNYLSFKDIVTLSMVPTSISELEESNVFSTNNTKLLKTSALYGANASGKSNLFKAMRFMKSFVLGSSKESQSNEKIKVMNFKLSTETENKQSFFEIIFICSQKKYRYGFEVDNNKVFSEWLFFVPKTKEARLFTRINNKIKLGTYFKEGKGLTERTRDNSLFLSVVAQFNGKISIDIMKWFLNFNPISGLVESAYMGFTLDCLEDKNFLNKALNYLKIVDLGIKGIKVQKTNMSVEEFPGRIPPQLLEKVSTLKYIENIAILFSHQKFNDNKTPYSEVEFNMEESESDGTKKFFKLLVPLIDTLDKGKILCIDELEARFHPLITRLIIELFNSKQTNPHNAQLIFATHDTNMLTNDLFRRDQIWFLEKNEHGSSDLYSLVEYKNMGKSIRKDASFDKDYIAGKYGAIPFIGDFEALLGIEDE